MGTERPPFGEWLAAEMARRGWETADLARALDVRYATVSRWVLGSRRPDTGSCAQLAEVLGLPENVVLYMAGHLSSLPQSVSAYERERELREIKQRLSQLDQHEVEVADVADEIPVRFYGAVPMDAGSWAQREATRDMRRVLRDWLGTRSPNEFLVVQASSDQFVATHVIGTGDFLLMERVHETAVANGDLVLVRTGDDVDLGIWRREGDWITLGTGTSNDRRISIFEDFAVIARYVGKRWSE